MPGKRIPQLDAIAGASTANDDNLVIYDTDAGTTKRILRSQLAAGLVGDLPYTPAGFIAATTVPTAIAEIASDLSASSGSSLVGYTQGSSGAVPRTADSKLREAVSVKDFGAVGDGVTDDQAAIQAAVDSGAKRIYFPAGAYFSSQSIKLKHTGAYFRRDTGQVFYGDGVFTILTRNQTNVAQGANDVAWNTNAFFSVYGSYNEFQQFRFENCPIAIYFGQDPAQIGIEDSHTSFNKMRNLLIQNCGTGILSASAQGHYYNHYETIHIAQCQIAVYFTVHSASPLPSTTDNNNRNTFLNIRAGRCQVGFWLENGDTNSVYSFHCEGCGTTPTNNSYPVPSGLPGSLTTAAFIIQGDNNDFFGCFHESNDFYVYHDALNTQSFGNLFRINEEPAKQTFVTPFFHHFDRSTAWIWNGTFARTSNSNATAFPNAVAGFAVVNAASASGGLDVGRQTLIDAPTTGTIGGYPVQRRENVVALGAVAALGTASFTLWAEVTQQTSSSSFFEVTVVGNSQTNTRVHANTFKVVVFRNTARTPTRFHVYDQVVGMGTGANAGSGAEPIVPSLTLGGANTKDVILTFTMPNRTFESISVHVVQVFTKA